MKRLGAVIALTSLASIGWAATAAADEPTRAPAAPRVGHHHPGHHGPGSDSSRYGTGYRQPPYEQQAPYDYRPGTTTPTGSRWYATGDFGEDREESRPHSGMLVTGMTMLIGSYAATAVVAATSPNPADENLWIPVAGPWMNLAERRCDFGECGMGEDVNQALLVAGGVTQGLGAVLTLLSFVVPEQREQRMPVTPIADEPKIRITPVSFGRGVGIGAVGRF